MRWALCPQPPWPRHPVQEVAWLLSASFPLDKGRGEVFLGWGDAEAGSHFVAGLVIL